MAWATSDQPRTARRRTTGGRAPLVLTGMTVTDPDFDLTLGAPKRGRNVPSDGGRGSEYRWGDWFVRIFGPECGYLFTPARLDHRLYARWSFGMKRSNGWGFWLGRDEDDEMEADIRFGRFANLTIALPEYTMGAPR